MSRQQREKRRNWARELGKLGGEKRKEQKPDYSQMGKKGARSRWDKQKQKSVTTADGLE